MIRRFKVTRIEIWEVDDAQPNIDAPSELVEDMLDAIQDDLLNGQDVIIEIGECALPGVIEAVPKEIVQVAVEEVKE